MRNRYPGTCYRCQQPVAVNAGHFERHGHGWRTQHAECAIIWRGKPQPTVEEARAALESYVPQPEKVKIVR